MCVYKSLQIFQVGLGVSGIEMRLSVPFTTVIYVEFKSKEMQNSEMPSQYMSSGHGDRTSFPVKTRKTLPKYSKPPPRP